jgi:hypothetical protein
VQYAVQLFTFKMHLASFDVCGDAESAKDLWLANVPAVFTMHTDFESMFYLCDENNPAY